MAESRNSSTGSAGSPELKIAVVGAGPAGFYTTLELLQNTDHDVRVDMFDRLPTPYGLVRFGVAPDHQKIKGVIKVYERGVEAAGSRFRLFGNVTLGRDVTIEDLAARYHAIVLTFGAQTDRKLGIPGEDLAGVYAAREFVAWYNGHPDFQSATFDLTASRVVVVGIGNVAIDVARILTHTPEELATTDICDQALSALSASSVEEVVILARRGPLQAKCTPVELRELTQLSATDLVVSEEDLELDPPSAAMVADGKADRQSLKNVEVLRGLAQREPRPGRKVIRLRFYESPTEFVGHERVEAMKVRRNTLVEKGGRIAVEPTDREEVLPCEAVFRAIGYQVAPMPGVPFDTEWRAIPHTGGQVLDKRGGEPVPGLFVAGWAKRGPTGVIGTNKPDAVETVATLLEGYRSGGLPNPSQGDVSELLQERSVRYVTYPDWKLLDALEVAAGVASGRPRVKLTAVDAMLDAVAKEKLVAEEEASAPSTLPRPG